ncbi:TMEM175 family protein [Microbacterium sp. bgisy207]|uniref:TMEM175 family protein n=1 Tax=Microbacterium sp. bgisy207 TaxID=3413800 RepID=UPI003EBB4055
MTDAEPRATEESNANDELPSAERLKAFTDAVVAIAMTLLILPLMDSVTDADETSTAAWLAQEWPSLLTFMLSFVLIANFWLTHHRMFARVERVDQGLLWLTILWMFTIVWLPVATAITSTFDADPIEKLVYVGSLVLTSLVLTLTRIYLIRHPKLHHEKPQLLSEGLVVGIIITSLFALSLLVMLAIPSLNYWALFLLFLTWPLHSAIMRARGRVPGPRA